MAQPMPSEETVDNDQQNHAQSQEERHQLHSINSAVAIRQVPSEGIAFQLWPAAATLVALLDRQPASLSSLFAEPRRPLRLLELGSGTGLVGIAAAALLGASVTVTDLPHVLPNLQFNVDANAGILGVRGGAVNVAALSWGDRQEMEGIGRDYDVVLGSDVVYHDHLYEPLIETLRFFLLESEKQVVFFMAHLKRWKKEYFEPTKQVPKPLYVISSDIPPQNSFQYGISTLGSRILLPISIVLSFLNLICTLTAPTST